MIINRIFLIVLILTSVGIAINDDELYQFLNDDIYINIGFGNGHYGQITTLYNDSMLFQKDNGKMLLVRYNNINYLEEK